MQRVLKWFWWLVAVVAMLAVAAYFLAKKYEEPVRNYIVGEVNKRLNAPMHVSDINFSFLERFPSASLVMDSVWAEESIVRIGKADTLLFFRKVYLNLNIFDLIDGTYRINEIEARDGFIHLLVDEKGYDNFHIWKAGSDTAGFLLELDRLHIENGSFRYQNQLRQQDIRLRANDLWLNGRFSESSYTMAVKGDGEVHSFAIKGTDYLRNREVAVESDLDIITATETYAFRKGQLIIDRSLEFGVGGKLHGSTIDLHIIGHNLDIIRTLSLVPAESIAWLNDYTSTGIIDFDCTLKGVFGKTENPQLDMRFEVKDGAISKRDSKWKLTRLQGAGSLNNGPQRDMKTTILQLDRLKGEFNGDTFSTVFTVANFTQPTIDGSLQLNTSIEALDGFFTIEEIEQGVGHIAVDATIKTTLTNPNDASARDFLNASASGMVSITGASLKLRDDSRHYVVDTAKFQIQNNALAIHAYRGRINDCTVDLTGRAEHFLDYFFTDNGSLSVQGKITAGDVDLQALFPSRDEARGSSSVVIAFPARASWHLQIIAQSFVNGKFRAEEVSGFLTMNQFKAEASALHFLSQGGNVSGTAGFYRFADNQFGLKTQFSATDIDIKTLFQTFNDFEQNFITSGHLSGRADAEVQFQALCDSVLGINTETIIATADLIIRNGAITGFQPLISVADEIRKKPMLRLFVSTDELRKRLENVQFAELKNQVTIRNATVTIPQMEIKSSAIDLNVAGTHTFDNRIDYAMDFALSELLEMKNRTEPYNEYVQRDQSGKTRMYLTMKGTTSNFNVELERTNLRTTLKEGMVSEKNTVKDLLKQEFRPLTGDTGAAQEKPVIKKVEIEFDPEAGSSEKTTQTATTPTEEKQPENKGKLKTLIKKAENKDKKLGEGDFEDDDF